MVTKYNGIRFGNEFTISIGKWDGVAWQYEVIAHREGFSPEIPDETQAVYDKLTYKGEKSIRDAC